MPLTSAWKPGNRSICWGGAGRTGAGCRLARRRCGTGRWNSLQNCGKPVGSRSESRKRPKHGSRRTMFSAGENDDGVKRSDWISARAPRPARRWRTLVVPVGGMAGKEPIQQQTDDTPHSRTPRASVHRSWKSCLSRNGLDIGHAAAPQRLKASVGPAFSGEGSPAETPLSRPQLDQTMRGRPAWQAPAQNRAAHMLWKEDRR